MIYLITGGQRSGKSAYAENLALSLSDSPVYIATARILDDDFRRRVEAHKARRGPCWTNIEESEHLACHPQPGRTVLVDCLTLLATSLFFAAGEDPSVAFEAFRDDFDRFCDSSHGASLIFVTNEIGLGGMSENRTQRRFADLQGDVNRYVASRADSVTLIVAGIPLRVK